VVVHQVLTDAGAPLPSGVKLADLLRRHDVGLKSINYRLFLAGKKYTRKSWRLPSEEDDQKSKRMKLRSFPRRPVPLFIYRRPRAVPGNCLSPQKDFPHWEPPYVELRLSDVRPISVERPGHVYSDDRAWYANRYAWSIVTSFSAEFSRFLYFINHTIEYENSWEVYKNAVWYMSQAVCLSVI